VPGVRLIRYDEAEQNNYQYIVLEIDEPKTHISRDLILLSLHAENVLARRYFYPGCHRMEPYRSYFPHAGLLLPETERLCQGVLSLPTGTAIEAHDIDLICDLIRFVVEHGAEVSPRIPLPGNG
jgi:dTDP-4-amino-4,6-dideoxygalactose transaminase